MHQHEHIRLFYAHMSDTVHCTENLLISVQPKVSFCEFYFSTKLDLLLSAIIV